MSSSVTNVEWESAWSYRGAAHNAKAYIAATSVIAIAVMAGLFMIASVGSANSVRRQIILNNCSFNKHATPITRTQASLLLSMGVTQLFIFSLIANYVNGANASLNIIVLVFTHAMMVFKSAFKWRQDGAQYTAGDFLWPTLGMLFSFVGSVVMLMSYTDAWGTKQTDGKDYYFLASGIVVIVGYMITAMSPYTTDLKALVSSGEYYVALNRMEYVLVAGFVTFFAVYEVVVIGEAATFHYAIPFYFLLMIPLIALFSIMTSFLKNPSWSAAGSHLWNCLLCASLMISLLLSQFHVCSIPGVEGCMTKLKHRPADTFGLCLSWLITISLFAYGVVWSDHAPPTATFSACSDEYDTKNNGRGFATTNAYFNNFNKEGPANIVVDKEN